MRGVAGIALLVACGGGREPATGPVWGSLATAGGLAYFATYGETSDDEHAIWSQAEDGTATELWQGGPHDELGLGMAVNARDVFWTERQGTDLAALYAVDRSGGERRRLVELDNLGDMGEVVATDDAAFVSTTEQIVEVRLATGETRTFQPSGHIAERGGQLYVSTTDHRLLTLDPVVGSMRAIASLPATAGILVVDDASAYVATDAGIIVQPLDGGASQVLMQAPPVLMSLGASSLFVTRALTPRGAPNYTEALIEIPLHAPSGELTLRDDLHYVFGVAAEGASTWIAQCACSEAGFVDLVAGAGQTAD